MAAQVGNVLWAFYHGREPREFAGVETGAFKKMVRPGEKVTAKAVFGAEGGVKHGRITSRVELRFSGGPKDGESVFAGVVSTRIKEEG